MPQQRNGAEQLSSLRCLAAGGRRRLSHCYNLTSCGGLSRKDAFCTVQTHTMACHALLNLGWRPRTPDRDGPGAYRRQSQPVPCLSSADRVLAGAGSVGADYAQRASRRDRPAYTVGSRARWRWHSDQAFWVIHPKFRRAWQATHKDVVLPTEASSGTRSSRPAISRARMRTD